VLEMTTASRRIANGDLSVRVPVRTGDEVGELAQSFNTMAQDLARQQREIERRERLAAWADMAAQVAHEVKNPLTPIQLSAEHLQRAYRASGISSAAFDSVVAVCTKTILESVTRLRDIASEFAAFVRAPVDRSQRVDIGAITRAVIQPYQDVLPEGLRLTVRLEDAVFVLGESKLIERAVRNLVENAQRYAGGCTRLTVLCSGDRWSVTVDDAGPGVSEDERDRIFERFHRGAAGTAPGAAKGTGLGLSLVAESVRAMGGGVSVTTSPDGGARFVVDLPVRGVQFDQDAVDDDGVTAGGGTLGRAGAGPAMAQLAGAEESGS